MADVKQYPRFQYSEFIKDGDRDGQIVIRSDDKAEFEGDKKYIDTIIAKHKQAGEQKKTIHTESSQADTSTEWLDKGVAPRESRPDYCFIHKVAMKAREGRFGTFYSHWLGKDSQGKSQYCNGKVK